MLIVCTYCTRAYCVYILYTCLLCVHSYICRRPFGVEQEFFIELIEETDSNTLPTVGDLIKNMFNEQKMSFTMVFY